MGCKSWDACKNNRQQNFGNRWPNNDSNQCRPSKARGPSVCRQCCDTSPDCGNKIIGWSLNRAWGWKSPNFVTYKPGQKYYEAYSSMSRTLDWEDAPSKSNNGFQVSREEEITVEERLQASRAFQKFYDV